MGYRWQKYQGHFDRSDVITNKDRCADTYAGYFYTRLLKMFKYEGLPETIPQDVLEYYLLRNGSCFITEAEVPNDKEKGTQVGVDTQEKKLFAFIGNPGGIHDVYYRPTLYVCSNPYLELTFEKPMWGDEGVFCMNDSMWIGLHPLIQRYSYLMAENVLTMRTADIMLRIVALISASDDKTKLSADQYLADIEDGKLGAIGDNPFFEGVKMQSPPSNNGSYLTQFIELHQYYKGSFYNEIGLQANFNMKREAIGVGEAAMGEDSLLPLCDDMLEKRKEMCEKLNSLYGLNVTVDFSSAWKQNREEIELDLESKKSEVFTEEGGEESAEEEIGESDGNVEIEESDGDVESEESTVEEDGEGKDSSGDEGVNTQEMGEDRTSEDQVQHETEADNEEAGEADSGIEVDIVVKVGDDDVASTDESEDSGGDDTDSGSVQEDEL